MTRDHDLLIVGGGPAALAAALAAASSGRRVVALERLDAPGRRLCATGGGHGNIGNRAPLAKVISAFGPAARFVKPALSAYYRRDGGPEGFMERLGIPCVSEDGFHWFPASRSAAEVRNALVREAAAAGAEILTGRKVGEVTPCPEGGFRVLAESRRGQPPEEFRAAAVVIAAGGPSRPALGGSADGLELARSLGHATVPVHPALCGLEAAADWPKTLTGISLPSVAVKAEAAGGDGGAPVFPPAQAGALSFTHAGLSGPAVLNLSGAVNAARAAGAEVALWIDFTPGRNGEVWRERLGEFRRREGARPLSASARGLLPDAVAKALAEVAGVARIVGAQASKAQQEAWIAALTACRLAIVGSDGWDRAMAARGGVARDEVAPATLASRRWPGLAFAGEVLDVDGPCGGYNLTWAFASGLAAGRHSNGPGQD